MMKHETYKQWLTYILNRIDEQSCQWNRVGIWGFPSKRNTSFHDILIHYCRAYHIICMRDNYPTKIRQFHKCEACGVEAPDGIKMIALLENL